ncbi:MAG: hypothetical protein ACYC27_15320 [Armatimonadota bacterium]
MLSELIRLSTLSSPDEAHRLTNQVLERQVDIIWEDDGIFMVLDNTLTASERVLVCLYKRDRILLEELQDRVSYQNKPRFKRMIQELQRQKLLALTTDDFCMLSPLGVIEAEKLIDAIQNTTK